MTAHRPFAELRKVMAPERRARNAEATQGLLRTMALHELRQAQGKAQAALAQDLHVGQPAVAKMEQRTDIYASNLRRDIEALGGTLDVTARFPDEEVRVTEAAYRFVAFDMPVTRLSMRWGGRCTRRPLRRWRPVLRWVRAGGESVAPRASFKVL